MSERPTDNAEQQKFWSDDAGPNWIAHQAAMDALLDPVLKLVLDSAALQSGDHVLDIGCGAGTSTAQAARYVADGGSATGLDISETLLKHAKQTFRDRKGLSFLLADAQIHAFNENHYDALISRFGVMFFADSVAAFTNMARALKPGGRIIMASWGPAARNPWFMLPAQVASDHFGPSPKTDRTLPGPFAFEDQSRVGDILTQAGLSNIRAETHKLHLTPAGTVAEAAKLCCHIGPAQAALRNFDGDAQDRAIIQAGICEAFAPFDRDTLRIPADINLFSAYKPA